MFNEKIQNMNQPIMNIVAIPEDQLRLLIREELSACQKLAKAEPEIDPLFTVSQCQDHILKMTGKRPARQTIYDKVYNRRIPFEKYSKYLYFRRSTIDAWLQNGCRTESN
jgi:hypothetical protein